MSTSVRHPGRLAAALIALLMLSYASVRSTVMQVAMAAAPASAPMCDGGMAMRADAMAPQARSMRLASANGAHPPVKSCPYCADAAQPPLPSLAAPPLSSSAVQFVAYRTQRPHAARGPPSLRPRARDPPVLVLSI